MPTVWPADYFSIRGWSAYLSWLWLSLYFLHVLCSLGGRVVPGIPRVPQAPADLPHVVHWDGQLHRRGRRSLGLLSRVSGALLNQRHSPPNPFVDSFRNNGLLWGARDQLPGQFDYIFPGYWRIVDLARGTFCVENPFHSFFSGQELNWTRLSFETLNDISNSKKSLCQCFL